MTKREIMEELHRSLMVSVDYFEAACLRRAKIERKRLRDSIVTTPTEGRAWHGKSSIVRKARRGRSAAR